MISAAMSCASGRCLRDRTGISRLDRAAAMDSLRVTMKPLDRRFNGA
jgi:hypothetical protein